MRILTKIKCRFRTPDGNEFVSQGQNLVEDAPDWIEKDPLFPLVLSDGKLLKLDTVPVVQGSADVSKPKKTAVKKK